MNSQRIHIYFVLLDVYTTIMKDPKSLDDNIIYLIGETSRLVHKKVTKVFSDRSFDVTVEQFGILVVLWYKEGIRQQDIAVTLNRDKTTIARIVENMINKDLIVKVPDQVDKRNKLIYLTKKGKALQKQMIASSGSVYMQSLKGFSDEELAMGLKIVKKIMNNSK